MRPVEDRAKTALESIAGLDILRFGAAFLVALYHLGSTDWLDKNSDGARALGPHIAYSEAYPFSWFGFVGVEIFFVISGIVIAYSALKQTPWRFAQNRMLRLYPAAWICASITTALSAAIGLYGPNALAQRWLFSVGLAPVYPWVDSVYWTLGIEMIFYAGIFMALLLARHRLYEFGLLIGIASSTYWLAGVMLFPTFLQSHLWTRWLDLSLLHYGLYFGLGVVLFMRNTRLRWFDVAFLAYALLASCIEISMKVTANLATFARPAPRFVPLAVFLAALVFIEISFRLKVSARTGAAFRTLGIATYPFYLMHNVVGAATVHWLVGLGVDRWAALAAALAIVAVLSIAVSSFAEPKLRAALKAMMKAEVPPKPAEALAD